MIAPVAYRWRADDPPRFMDCFSLARRMLLLTGIQLDGDASGGGMEERIANGESNYRGQYRVIEGGEPIRPFDVVKFFGAAGDLTHLGVIYEGEDGKLRVAHIGENTQFSTPPAAALRFTSHEVVRHKRLDYDDAG